MSVSELAVGLVLVVLSFAAGFVKGRSTRSRSPRSVASPAPRNRSGSSAPAPQSASFTAMPNPDADAERTRSDLAGVRTWGYQLQDLDVLQAAASPFDLLVVDYAKDGSDDTALSPAEIARLQVKPDGSRRLVLAYLSVGEAESYRYYWRKQWRTRRPRWLLRENPDWDQSYAVRFWDRDWQALLFGRPAAYLDKVLAQGFDGVYLDKCDVAPDLRRRERRAAGTRKDLDGDMVELIQRLAAYARTRRPGFMVVLQNAEPLLQRTELRRQIDGVAKEELFFGLDAAETANSRADIDWARERLDLVRRDGKPVLVVEYLDDAAKIAQATRAAHEHGYVLYVADKSRELDILRTEPLAM